MQLRVVVAAHSAELWISELIQRVPLDDGFPEGDIHIRPSCNFQRLHRSMVTVWCVRDAREGGIELRHADARGARGPDGDGRDAVRVLIHDYEPVLCAECWYSDYSGVRHGGVCVGGHVDRHRGRARGNRRWQAHSCGGATGERERGERMRERMFARVKVSARDNASANVCVCVFVFVLAMCTGACVRTSLVLDLSLSSPPESERVNE